MKKIFVVIIFCSLTVHGFGQLIGAGTFASPWSGTLTGNTTWSGSVYINGDITVDNEVLTISPGTKVIFLAEGSDLIIEGTGRLNAQGAPSSMITFTADDNNNGILGEPGERWGHISFQNMTTGFTTRSTIDYCIVEFGEKNTYSSTWNFESSGGGINTACLAVR